MTRELTNITHHLLRPLRYTLLATAALTLAGAAQAVVINIDATVYGYQFPNDPAPVVVIVNDACKAVVFYADAGGVQSSQAAIASQVDVQSFSSSFTTAQTTTLDFMVRDCGVYDNADGMALNIPTAVPEPGTWALLAAGGLFVLRAARRRA